MNYKRLWDRTDRGAKAHTEFHTYHVGDNAPGPRFPRIEAFDAVEPSEHGDEWRKWNRTRTRELLGGGRVSRRQGYTAFPSNEKINAAILAVANKFVPARFDEKGIPCEDFRDMCNHLVLDGLHTFSDGEISTYYLEKKAVVYLNKLGTDTAVSRFRLDPKPQRADR